MIKRLFLVFCFLLLAFMNTFSQEPSIQIALETNHFLFGQPVWAKYTITNLSKEDIFIGGKEVNGKFYLLEWDAKAFYPDDKEVPQHRGGTMTVGNRPTPKKKLTCGDSVTWSQMVPVTDVTIDQLPAGKYKLVFYLKYSLKAEEGVFEKDAEAETIFFIDTPEGEDAAWLKDAQDVKKVLYQKDTTRVALNQPLTWWDVLDYAFYQAESKDIGASLLQKYPTSTYAGYELAKCAKENLQDYINMSDEEIDEALGVRGLIPEKQDAYRKERQKYFQEKLNLLQAFNAAHPDFVKADMIQSGIAFYLLLLGRQNEAVEEIKILAKMEGRWAEGAKKALEKISQKEEKDKAIEGETSKQKPASAEVIK